MGKNIPIILHDSKRLVRIERWARRFAWLALGGVILTLVNFVFYFENSFSGSSDFNFIEAFGLFNKYVGLWDKLRVLFTNMESVLGYLAGFFIFQGLSKIIRYLLNLKTLAFNRYHARKTSA